MHYSCLRTWIVGGIFFLLLILSSGVVRAGEWPTEYTGSLYFYSTDPTPIEVTLRNLDDPNMAHKAILHIPRAAIVFANNYDARNFTALPDKIETNDVILALTYPDGKPLILHAKELAAEEKISLYEAIKRLRVHEYKAQISYTPPDNPWEAREREDRRRFQITDKYDGMLHAPADYYFGKAVVDEFVRVHCYPEATPIYFCNTEMRIDVSLVAVVDFADFRFHGGRKYLNEHARKLRDAICRYEDPPCRRSERRKKQ